VGGLVCWRTQVRTDVDSSFPSRAAVYGMFSRDFINLTKYENVSRRRPSCCGIILVARAVVVDTGCLPAWLPEYGTLPASVGEL